MSAQTERRRATRLKGRDEHGIIRARVRPGHDVAIVDVSAGGALIETERRLLPGSAVDLQIATPEREVAVRGRVLRCAVARLHPAAVWYRGAVGFEHHLPWLAANEWPADAGLPGADPHVRRVTRATGSPSLIG